MNENNQKSEPPPANLPVEPTKPSAPKMPTPPPIGGRPMPPTPPRPTPPFRPSPPKPTMPPRPTAGLGTRPPMPPRPLQTPPKPTPPPTPQPPEISLRTMKSDLEKLKEKPGAPTPLKPPAKPPVAPIGLKAERAPKKRMPKLFLIGGVIIFGIILALVGYFIVFPWLFPTETPGPIAPITPSTPDIPDLLPPTAKPHQTLLKTPADFQASLSVSNLTALRQVLLSEANKPTGTNVLKEVLLSDSSGQLDFSSVLPVFLSGFSKSELSGFFEEDFTALIYYDANGTWPIFIAQLKSGASLSMAKAMIGRLENFAGLSNLFLTLPGTPNSAGFKNGQVQNMTTRYLTFSKQGAALNYGWLGNKLIISTSYNGLKKVLGNF